MTLANHGGPYRGGIMITGQRSTAQKSRDGLAPKLRPLASAGLPDRFKWSLRGLSVKWIAATERRLID